jgi:hypothetical protein
MATGGEGVVPNEGMSSGTASSGSPLSFLNAEWINKRVVNVQMKANALLDRLIDDGLLGSGYPPFEVPVTDEMLAKMTPAQFRTYYDTLTTLQAKSEALQRMKALKLPPVELMPFAEKAHYPVPKPTAGNFGPPPVQSSATV